MFVQKLSKHKYILKKFVWSLGVPKTDNPKNSSNPTQTIRIGLGLRNFRYDLGWDFEETTGSVRFGGSKNKFSVRPEPRYNNYIYFRFQDYQLFHSNFSAEQPFTSLSSLIFCPTHSLSSIFLSLLWICLSFSILFSAFHSLSPLSFTSNSLSFHQPPLSLLHSPVLPLLSHFSTAIHHPVNRELFCLANVFSSLDRHHLASSTSVKRKSNTPLQLLSKASL